MVFTPRPYQAEAIHSGLEYFRSESDDNAFEILPTGSGKSVVIARSTMSLALYYQIVGRGMRPAPGKESCWIVDLGGNIKFFGKIETMKIQQNEKGQYSIWNNGRQLTNISFSKS